jgi:hypothetical protein
VLVAVCAYDLHGVKPLRARNRLGVWRRAHRLLGVTDRHHLTVNENLDAPNPGSTVARRDSDPSTPGRSIVVEDDGRRRHGSELILEPHPRGLDGEGRGSQAAAVCGALITRGRAGRVEATDIEGDAGLVKAGARCRAVRQRVAPCGVRQVALTTFEYRPLAGRRDRGGRILVARLGVHYCLEIRDADHVEAVNGRVWRRLELPTSVRRPRVGDVRQRRLEASASRAVVRGTCAATQLWPLGDVRRPIAGRCRAEVREAAGIYVVGSRVGARGSEEKRGEGGDDDQARRHVPPHRFRPEKFAPHVPTLRHTGNADQPKPKRQRVRKRLPGGARA